MNEFLLENLVSNESLSAYVILANNLVAIAAAFFVMFTYKLTYSGAAYSRKFNISLGMITLITTMIMSVISNNIALSLGMVGALSIIRFRTAVKDVRDAAFIFWVIAIGIGSGVSQYSLIGIGSAFIFIFMLLLRQVVPDNQQLLVVQGELAAQNRIEAAVVTHFQGKAHQTMKNATEKTCELVYAIPASAIRKYNEKKMSDIVQILAKIPGVHRVNLVEQLDDIGR